MNDEQDLQSQALSDSFFILLPSSFQTEAGGIRTPTVRVKSSLCCRYTTTPNRSQYLFQSMLRGHHVVFLQ